MAKNPKDNDRAPTPQQSQHKAMTLEEALDMQQPFGTHQGKTLAWIADHEPSYIDWLMSIVDTIRSARLKEALPLVADAYAEEIEAAVRDNDDRR